MYFFSDKYKTNKYISICELYIWSKVLGPLMPGSSLRGPATPKWDLHPRLAEKMACTGLLHHLLSRTPTRGGSSLMAKLEHPSLGSVGGAEATTPTFTNGPACEDACGLSSFLSGLPLVFLFLTLLFSPLGCRAVEVPAPSLFLLLRPSSLA